MERALNVARNARQHISGVDGPLSDTAIHFFDALIGFIKAEAGQPYDKSTIGRSYQAAQAEMSKSSNPKFCVIQVPVDLARKLAIFLGEPMLDPDHTIKVAAKSATSRYCKYSLSIVAAFAAVCAILFIAGYRVALPYFLAAVVTTFILGKYKNIPKEDNSGLVSSEAVENIDRVWIAVFVAAIFLSLEVFRDFFHP